MDQSLAPYFCPSAFRSSCGTHGPSAPFWRKTPVIVKRPYPTPDMPWRVHLAGCIRTKHSKSERAATVRHAPGLRHFFQNPARYPRGCPTLFVRIHAPLHPFPGRRSKKPPRFRKNIPPDASHPFQLRASHATDENQHRPVQQSLHSKDLQHMFVSRPSQGRIGAGKITSNRFVRRNDCE